MQNILSLAHASLQSDDANRVLSDDLHDSVCNSRVAPPIASALSLPTAVGLSYALHPLGGIGHVPQRIDL